MKILITGATGLIGKELGKKLVEDGHDITILTRSPSVAQKILPYPAKILEWKSYNDPIPSSYFDGIESVIHLAGESISGGRWTKKKKKLIIESRKIGTRNIVNSILASKRTVKQFISASAIGIYGNENDFLSKVCLEWEKEASVLLKDGITVINPRIGVVLAKNGGALEKMLPIFSSGLGAVLGDGKQWMNWIHIDDLVGLFSFFISRPQLSGALNAISPHPVTNEEFSTVLANGLEKRLFFPVPSFALKLLLGEMSLLVLEGEKLSAQDILDLGFEFKYPSIELALEHLCYNYKNHQKEFNQKYWLQPKKRSESY